LGLEAGVSLNTSFPFKVNCDKSVKSSYFPIMVVAADAFVTGNNDNSRNESRQKSNFFSKTFPLKN
jgi:hypothetical protein